MWNLVRTLLFALAMAGFVGQSSAHATPFEAFEATGVMAEMDCAEMMVMTDDTAATANVVRKGAGPLPLKDPPKPLA